MGNGKKNAAAEPAVLATAQDELAARYLCMVLRGQWPDGKWDRRGLEVVGPKPSYRSPGSDWANAEQFAQGFLACYRILTHEPK
jgi:hypothetical protein